VFLFTRQENHLVIVSGYFEVVRDVLGNHSKTCIQAISEGTKEIGRLLSHGAGQSQLNEIFRFVSICKSSIKFANRATKEEPKV